MATNSSIIYWNHTVEGEVGWQDAPETRGTADILWNCVSVIILITWTGFHTSVGSGLKQRIMTAITATLVPELSALVALRDMIFAYRLRYCLKKHVKQPGWNKGWNLTKSLLVIKGGICAGSPRIHPSNDTGCTQSASMTVGKIMDPETFLRLAAKGSISYEDFPITEEINDKSKADWFAKGLTMLQLAWAVINICIRLINFCGISAMEVMIFDWGIFGPLAIILWWKCPQNINIPYTIPVQDSPNQPRQGPLDNITPFENELGFYTNSRGCSFGSAAVLMFCFTIARFSIHWVFWFLYHWHSTPPKVFWIVCTTISTVSALVLFFADPQMRKDWDDESIYVTYLRPLMVEPPRSHGENNGQVSGWFALARGMGIYNSTDLKPWRRAKEEVKHDYDMKAVVAAVFVSLLCQAAKLVIAVMAFSSAPSSIYKVPKVWILEAWVHVGG